MGFKVLSVWFTFMFIESQLRGFTVPLAVDSGPWTGAMQGSELRSLDPGFG